MAKTQRLLSLHTKYTALGAEYIAAGVKCEHCGKTTKEVVSVSPERTVADTDSSRVYKVGADCADSFTYTNSGTWLRMQWQFSQGRQIRTKLVKLRTKEPDVWIGAEEGEKVCSINWRTVGKPLATGSRVFEPQYFVEIVKAYIADLINLK